MDRAGAPHPDPPGEVLRTQLVAPPPRPHALARRHLVDRLRAVSAPGRLTLVAAGAGWGKTTLVASWIRAEPDRAAWFSVDATDSDPVRFWGAVIAALDGVAPGFATRSARLLGAPGTSTATDVVPALLDELAALDAPVTLVVDDYHLADSAEIHVGRRVPGHPPAGHAAPGAGEPNRAAAAAGPAPRPGPGRRARDGGPAPVRGGERGAARRPRQR